VSEHASTGALNLQDMKMTDLRCCSSWSVQLCRADVEFYLVAHVKAEMCTLVGLLSIDQASLAVMCPLKNLLGPVLRKFARSPY